MLVFTPRHVLMCICAAKGMEFNVLKYCVHHTKALTWVKASSIKNQYWHLRKTQDYISSFIFVLCRPSRYLSDTSHHQFELKRYRDKNIRWEATRSNQYGNRWNIYRGLEAIQSVLLFSAALSQIHPTLLCPSATGEIRCVRYCSEKALYREW